MRRHCPQRGAAAVELALVLIPLTLLLLACVDLARALMIYDQLTKAARDGARYLSFFDPAVASEYPTQAARNRMLYGTASPTSSAKTIVPGFSSSMIQICDRVSASACPGEQFANVTTGTGSLNLVKVTVSGYRFTPIFPGASRLAAVSFEPISVTVRQVYP